MSCSTALSSAAVLLLQYLRLSAYCNEVEALQSSVGVAEECLHCDRVMALAPYACQQACVQPPANFRPPFISWCRLVGTQGKGIKAWHADTKRMVSQVIPPSHLSCTCCYPAKFEVMKISLTVVCVSNIDNRKGSCIVSAHMAVTYIR